jgi:hypothetical protein
VPEQARELVQAPRVQRLALAWVQAQAQAQVLPLALGQVVQQRLA